MATDMREPINSGNGSFQGAQTFNISENTKNGDNVAEDVQDLNPFDNPAVDRQVKHENVKFRTKTISWFNPAYGSLMVSKVLIQNQNGPCALIAIVNALMLNYQLKHNYQVHKGYLADANTASQSAETEQLVKLVDSKDVVAFVDIIGILGLILVSGDSKSLAKSVSHDSGLPAMAETQPAAKLDEKASENVTEILDLLPHLNEGLNINANFLTGKIDNSVPDVCFSLPELLNSLEKDESPYAEADAKDTDESASSTGSNAEVALFKAYGLGIYHGWVASPILDCEEYKVIEYLKNFDICQNFLIYVDDLLENRRETKPSNGKGKVSDDEAMEDDPSYGQNPFNSSDVESDAKQSTPLTPVQQDILYSYSKNVRNWLNKSGSQLTDAGIENLKQIVEPDKFVIFFRNDHFSTLFKRTTYNEANDKQYELYCLVTDEGFANLKNVVWQELKSVNGSEEQFYDRNFIPVDLSHTISSKPGKQTVGSSSGLQKPESDFAKDLYKTSQGEFNHYDEDDVAAEDFKLARILQEKEDAYVAQKLLKGYHKKPKASNNYSKTAASTAAAAAGSSAIFNKKPWLKPGQNGANQPHKKTSKDHNSNCILM